jgi:hypothetical protein
MATAWMIHKQSGLFLIATYVSVAFRGCAIWSATHATGRHKRRARHVREDGAEAEKLRNASIDEPRVALESPGFRHAFQNTAA